MHYTLKCKVISLDEPRILQNFVNYLSLGAAYAKNFELFGSLGVADAKTLNIRFLTNRGCIKL